MTLRDRLCRWWRAWTSIPVLVALLMGLITVLLMIENWR